MRHWLSGRAHRLTYVWDRNRFRRRREMDRPSGRPRGFRRDHLEQAQDEGSPVGHHLCETFLGATSCRSRRPYDEPRRRECCSSSRNYVSPTSAFTIRAVPKRTTAMSRHCARPDCLGRGRDALWICLDPVARIVVRRRISAGREATRCLALPVREGAAGSLAPSRGTGCARRVSGAGCRRTVPPAAGTRTRQRAASASRGGSSSRQPWRRLA